MAINDFYWGEPGYEFPMGNIQLMGKTVIEGLRGYEAKYAPLTIEEVAQNSIDWWLTTEDLPDARNQVRVDGERIIIDYTENNSEPFARLNARWRQILQEIDASTDHPSPLIPIPVEGRGKLVGRAGFKDGLL